MIEKIIFNADDFGITSGVNQGIIECHKAGIVTSATLMVQGRAVDEAASLAARNPGLGVGLHLNLTSGPPVLPVEQVPSLVNSEGVFPGRARVVLWLSLGRIRTSQLEAEIVAQVERCRELGIEPTHVDSHHHIHAHPRLNRVLQRVGSDAGISKMRRYKTLTHSSKSTGAMLLGALEFLAPSQPMTGAAQLYGIETMGGRSYADRLVPLLEEGEGTTEVMCHPGYCDAALEESSSYNAGREAELRSLLAPELGRLLDKSKVKMISYRDL